MQEYIQEAEKVLLHTYNRYQIVLDRGEGVYLYDTDGIKYLDFASGIGVFALGYNNKEYSSALKAQIDRLLHTSNYYYNVPAISAAKKLTAASGMDRVFFTNSGAEAIEGALKAARKYAYLKDGGTDHEIIAMNHSFHGRTFGALSVTGTPKYREPFEPMIGNIRFADLNDMDSVRAQVTDKTCAILLEPVQGEGGIIPASENFLKEVKALCEEKDILLILDEIQCGMGRTGYLYAWQRYGVKPDIMTTAKALGCGVPVGAFLMTEKVAGSSPDRAPLPSHFLLHGSPQTGPEPFPLRCRQRDCRRKWCHGLRRKGNCPQPSPSSGKRLRSPRQRQQKISPDSTRQSPWSASRQKEAPHMNAWTRLSRPRNWPMKWIPHSRSTANSRAMPPSYPPSAA